MKKNQFLLLFLAAVMLAAMTMIGCTKADNPVDPNADTEYFTGVASTSNGLLLFQNSIVRIDNQGNFISRVNGEPLDEADTTVVSIGVDDLAEARRIFTGWLPGNADIQEVAPNVLTYYPKNEDGQKQGEIYFTPSDSPKQTAVVTFSDDTDLRHFTAIEFIPRKLWPENGLFHTIISGGTNKLGEKKLGEDGYIYYVVREKKEGLTGIAIRKGSAYHVCEMEYRWDILAIDCITLSLATEVANIASADWESFKQWAPFVEDKYCEEMWTNTRDYHLGKIRYQSIDLKNNIVYDHHVYPHDGNDKPMAEVNYHVQLFGFAY